jgi:tetratricopeptide (TPR) repeat protein
MTGRQAPRQQAAPESAPSPPVRWFRELPISVALMAIILVAYWGVWLFEFVYFDDPGYVTDNLNVIRGLPLFKDFKVFCASVRWAFTAFEQSNWHPLTWLSHMLDVQLYGLNAGGHHVTNIILHASNTLLLFWLLRWLTGRSWCSAAVAVLFAVHPMHVESVVWVAERKDMLSTFLGFLGLLAYVRYAKEPDVYRYIPVFVLLALGLLAKPMLVTFPCVCLLLDFWPLGRLNLWGDAELPARRPPLERAAVPRRKAKRNQRLPATATRPQSRPVAAQSVGQQIAWLVVEKIPLFVLAALSAIITPYAQNHGGSMASPAELSLAFRIENSLQSYLTYITRMFWPGKMSVLYLLDPEHVNHYYTAGAVVVLLSITGLVIWAAYRGRRYLAFGWFWYLGVLVPVIGLVQVGEQSHADRYTYLSYVGLFIMLAWGIADLISLLPEFQAPLRVVTGTVMALVLVVCVGWTKYQLQFWTDVETHLRHALSITPDNWNMLNNLGVKLWKKGQDEDILSEKAKVLGDMEGANAHHQKALAFKADAAAQWTHGITVRPTATDIHSNLGYMYSEANDLDKAEHHLREAVKWKEISPRPRNNLGRVLLRRSQEWEAQARKAEAEHKTDPDAWAKSKQYKDAAIVEFEKAVELDPSLLEARLNLGQVYIEKNELDKAERHYKEILKLDSESVKDREAISNFSQASFGLGRIAVARKNSDEAVRFFEHALETARRNATEFVDGQPVLELTTPVLIILQWLAGQRFERGEYREGEKCAWLVLSRLTDMGQRRFFAEQLGRQCEAGGKHTEAVHAWSFMAWALAASPDPRILDPQEAMALAKHVVEITKQQDPLSLDVLAAAQAATGQFGAAVQTAQSAVNLANSQGKKPLAAAISQRLPFYQQGKPYRCDRNGTDRPE